MICMVLNTILYMDGDVKQQDHRTVTSTPTHKDQCVPWYLLPFNPISNVCIMHVNVYTLMMLYMKGHVDDCVVCTYMYMCNIVPNMLAGLLYPYQYDGDTPLNWVPDAVQHLLPCGDIHLLACCHVGAFTS